MTANLDRFHRFDWGVPPASKGDWAFLLHMLHSLRSNGRMAAVVPHGVLFRGSAEGRIRQTVIEKNLLDAVIGLPANLFYGTGIPVCVLVLKKERNGNSDNILFIDASKEFEKVKTQNKLRPEHIQKIVDTYRNRTEIEKYSHLASLQEIKDVNQILIDISYDFKRLRNVRRYKVNGRYYNLRYNNGVIKILDSYDKRQNRYFYKQANSSLLRNLFFMQGQPFVFFIQRLLQGRSARRYRYSATRHAQDGRRFVSTL